MYRLPIRSRERHPGEEAVEDADAIGDGDPGHVVLVRLDALADGVVGDDGLDQGLVGGEQDEEDRQGGQPVLASRASSAARAPAPRSRSGAGR